MPGVVNCRLVRRTLGVAPLPAWDAALIFADQTFWLLTSSAVKDGICSMACCRTCR